MPLPLEKPQLQEVVTPQTEIVSTEAPSVERGELDREVESVPVAEPSVLSPEQASTHSQEIPTVTPELASSETDYEVLETGVENARSGVRRSKNDDVLADLQGLLVARQETHPGSTQA